MDLKKKLPSILLLTPMVLLALTSYPGRFSTAYIVLISTIAVLFAIILLSKTKEIDEKTAQKKKVIFYIAVTITLLITIIGFYVNDI